MPFEMVCLTTVDDGIEVGMLEALLLDNNIPIVKRHREAGETMSILFGRSVYGIDILVSQNDFERAEGLVEFLRSAEFEEDGDGG
jgi:hypothetical protein